MKIFKATVHTNHSITQTHRITYLQNSVTGRAKDLIRGYSCNPALYDVALAELHSHFGSPQHVVNAYIKRLESWSRVSSQDPHTLVSFTTFLKQMVQSFTDLHYTADLQSSTVLSIAKANLPHNLLTKWTEYTVKCSIEVPTLLLFQQWLKIQVAVVEKLQPFLSKDTSHQPDSTERDFHRPKPSTSTPKKQRSCPLCNQLHPSARTTSRHLLPTNLRSSENTNFASTVLVVVTREVTAHPAITVLCLDAAHCTIHRFIP